MSARAPTDAHAPGQRIARAVAERELSSDRNSALARPQCTAGRATAMRESAGRIIRWLDRRVEFWLNFLFYGYLCAILVIEVAARWLFDYSLTWSVETAIYAFIWLTYLSMADLARSREHLSFTMIRDLLDRHGQFACFVVSDLALATVAVTIIVFVVQPLHDTVAFGLKMTGSELPMWLAQAAIPVGWAMVLLRVVQRFFELVANYRAGRPLVQAIDADA